MGYYTTKKEIGDYAIFEEVNPSIFKYIKLNSSFCGGNKRDQTKRRQIKRRQIKRRQTKRRQTKKRQTKKRQIKRRQTKRRQTKKVK